MKNQLTSELHGPICIKSNSSRWTISNAVAWRRLPILLAALLKETYKRPLNTLVEKVMMFSCNLHVCRSVFSWPHDFLRHLKNKHAQQQQQQRYHQRFPTLLVELIYFDNHGPLICTKTSPQWRHTTRSSLSFSISDVGLSVSKLSSSFVFLMTSVFDSAARFRNISAESLRLCRSGFQVNQQEYVGSHRCLFKFL